MLGPLEGSGKSDFPRQVDQKRVYLSVLEGDLTRKWPVDTPCVIFIDCGLDVGYSLGLMQ
jgi:hypothetical protein